MHGESRFMNALRATLLLLALAVLAFPRTAGAAGSDGGVVVQVLPNGLTVVLEEDHRRPLVAAALVVKGGSRTETPELSGLSHYYEHLLFRGGSKTQAELEFRKVMQQLGEESGGYTTDDYTNYGFTVPTANFREAFARSTDAWMDLIPTQSKVDNERQVVMEEYNQGRDRPDYRLYFDMLRNVFQVHPYRISPIGRKEVIEGASLETFRAFYEERYVPNQMILALVGDFEVGPTLEMVRERWSAYPPGHPSFEQGLIEPAQTAPRASDNEAETAITRAVVAWPIPPATHADLPALELLAGILSDGNSARLVQALRVQNDLANAVSAYADRRLDPGIFAIDVEGEPAKIGPALDQIAIEVARIAATPPLLDELERARASLLARRARDLETPFDRAEALAVAAMFGNALDVDRYPEMLRAVTRDDVSRAASLYLLPSRSNLSVMRAKGSATIDARAWVTRFQRDWAPKFSEDVANAGTTGAVRRLLKNGVTVVVQPDPRATVVGATALLRGGQSREPANQEGILSFVAALLDKGAMGKSQVEIAATLSSLGATLNLQAEPDFLSAALEVPGLDHRAALDVFADVILAPTFPPAEIEKARTDLLSRIRSLPDQPFDNLNRSFYEELYSNQVYAHPLLGTEAAIQAIQESDLRDFYKKYLTGTNLVLSVVGAVDPEAIFSWAEMRFGGLTAGPAFLADAGTPDLGPSSTKDIRVPRDQEQVNFNTGWPTLSVRDAEYVPLRLAVGVLADRFFFKYVYEKGVAYRSWVYQTERLGQGSTQNEMGVSPDVYEEISNEVVHDFDRFVSEPIPQAELDASRRKLISRHVLGLKTSSGLARRLAFNEAAGLGLAYIDEYPKLLNQVSSAEASAAAAKYLREGHWTRVAVGRFDNPKP